MHLITKFRLTRYMSVHRLIIIFAIVNTFILLWMIYEYSVYNSWREILQIDDNHLDGMELTSLIRSKDLRVYIVEEHHEVIPYWFDAAKSFGDKKAVLVHIDAHSDMDYPELVDGFPIGHFPRSRDEIETLMQANDEFIQGTLINLSLLAYVKSNDEMYRSYGLFMLVPPILRLVHDPPPIPPTNSSGRYTCTSSLCTTPIPEEHSNSNWTNACEILVAYPLVKSKNLIWAWTQPQWAAYIIRKVEEVGKANVLSDFSMLNDNEIGSYGPWEVLERRRRSTSTDSDMEKPDLVKSGPILFWCWANNDVGQTTIWWPGPVDSYSYSIWSSVWWPLLGVTLELLSLAVVFIFFRYCRRQRLRYGVGNTPETGGSFGRSRLLDTDADADQVEMKATNTSSSSSTSVIGLHTHGPIPYIRLSNQNKHSNNSNNNNINGNNNNNSFLTKITGINHSSTDGYMNPNLIQDPVDAEVEAMANVQNLQNERELIDDDYFWDSDTGGNNVDDNTTTKARNNHQTVA
ncbi:unnamed protein product [Trichobilharzia szidati]|nr:unnamed protein product [Trichobilharzia szidati]